MPRRPSSPPSVSHAVESLVHSIRALVESVGTAAANAVQVGKDAKAVKGAVVGKKPRGPGKGNPKLKAALKRYWAKMKGKARAERVARMLAGRGIRAKRSKPAAKKKGGWASMSPEQRAERIARMRAGRVGRARE